MFMHIAIAKAIAVAVAIAVAIAITPLLTDVRRHLYALET